MELRKDCGDLSPPVLTVDAKLAVHREDACTVMELGHPHNARVGERHGKVGVLAHQLPQGVALGEHVERCPDQESGVQELEEAARAVAETSDEIERLREHGLAREKRRA